MWGSIQRGARALWLLVWCCPLLLLLLTLLTARPASAQPLEWQDTPPELRGWIPWVLDSPGPELCPKVGEQSFCVWPGLLQIELQGSVGHFRLTLVVDQRTVVALPGSAQAWPQNILVNGNPGRIIDRGAVPSIELGKGAHTLEGDYFWTELPETLALPEHVALVSLKRDGTLVDFPKRDPKLLWLRATGGASDEPQRLSLEVFRKLKDNVPFTVTTQLSLRVAGKAREVNLGVVSLPGSSPLAISSALPVRLNEDLSLSVQVYAGNHTIEVESLFAMPPSELTSPKHEDPWPEAETWVFEPDPALRQVELSGAAAVDPNRTNLPEGWRRLAAYTVPGGLTVGVNTLRRGEPESPPNRLSLRRDIYLDLSGGACTVRDEFSGQMNRAWRLDLHGGELGRVLLAGEPQLITAHPESGKPGVELREGQLSLVAEWRMNGNVRQFPAVGWSEDVQELITEVHVPPGWQLLNAGGVDGVSETWLSSWDLFSLFFVLIVSIGIAQLMHPAWGALALVTMVLTHGEADAPRVLWAALLTCIALLRVIPENWLRKLIVSATLGVSLSLLITLGSYSVQEVRSALYPQADLNFASESSLPQEAPSAAPASKDLEAESDPIPHGKGVAGGLHSRAGGSADSASASKRATQQQAFVQQYLAEPEPVQKQQDPQAVVQTGPGVPSWSWRSWVLSWSGPVHREHVLHLYLLSPLGNALISFLRIGLAGFLAFLLLRYTLHQARCAPRKRNSSPAAAVLLPLCLAAATLLTPRAAHAEIPSEEVLGQLRERITRQPLCDPDCVSVQRMDVVMQERQLTISSEVHVTRDDSTQLPGPLQSWSPAEVTVNGAPAAGMVLAEDGFLHLRLPPGRYRVEVRGPVSGNNLTLSLGKKPRWVSVSAEGWEVDGISEAGTVEGSLGFHRKIATPERDEARQVTLPSWLLITRTLQFGATWSVRTDIERIGPTGSPIVQRLQLLPGEQVTRADLPVERGAAVLSLGRDEKSLSFESVLQMSPEVALVAQAGERLSERWVVQCGPIWRCETQGIAPVSHQSAGRWEPRYSPWPKDTLTIRPVRPKAMTGEVLTVDQAHLQLIPGTRLLNATLTSQLRTSNRSTMSIALPAAAELQELLLDGQPHVLQKVDDKLQIALDPGEHQLKLVWQEAGGMRFRFESPAVDVGAQAVNLRVSITVPSERWLLFAGGPRWGPAILFWGYLLAILVLSLVLARLPKSPLREWQWVVLGLGLTQVPAAVAALIVGWFFVFAFLSDWRPTKPWLYNGSQLSLVLLTVVFLGCLFGAVYEGLLSTPDMEVLGAGSSNHQLHWYVDRSNGALPEPWAITTSLWVWRAAMLVWALWLASNLLGWLRWAFGLFGSEGLWKKLSPSAPLGAPDFIPAAGGFSPTAVAVPGAQWVVTNQPTPSTPRSASAKAEHTPRAWEGEAEPPTTLPTGGMSSEVSPAPEPAGPEAAAPKALSTDPSPADASPPSEPNDRKDPT